MKLKTVLSEQALNLDLINKKRASAMRFINEFHKKSENHREESAKLKQELEIQKAENLKLKTEIQQTNIQANQTAR